ncbi:MAG: adenosylcobinamide-GDP ribazoletransferase [Desulforhabdus sp.]|jgi:adenosylcobinamide-GDP ribazoletransferase|nr:adenosylcobinamide-GDP ribazoletransferase [Desulforhabdus sp.]
MKNFYKRLTTAVSFLTVLPLPCSAAHIVDSADLARSFSFFPVAGLIIGAVCLIPMWILHTVMPPLLGAVLIATLLVLLTRGLHLDGLADLADGVGGGYTPERRLAIMKDSRIGTFGSVAVVLAMLFKVAGLHALIVANCWPPIILTPVFSRLAMVFTAYKSPYARPEGGLGKPFLEHMSTHEPLLAAAFACAFGLVVAPGLTLPYLAAVVFCATVFRLLGRHWLGGITGDVLGATNEVGEIFLFTLSACIVPFL